jgi:biotin carboxyl carrier protein
MKHVVAAELVGNVAEVQVDVGYTVTVVEIAVSAGDVISEGDVIAVIDTGDA